MAVKSKKVVRAVKPHRGFDFPAKIIFGSDETEATYNRTLPVSTHRAEQVYVYVYTKAARHHPKIESTKLGTELHLRQDNFSKIIKSLYTEFIYGEAK